VRVGGSWTSSGRSTRYTSSAREPGQLVLTPAGVRIGAVEADHDVRLGPASRLGGPVVLAQLGRVGIPIFEQVFHERQPARTLAGAGRRAEVSARAAA
jgi:hypothetical protein